MNKKFFSNLITIQFLSILLVSIILLTDAVLAYDASLDNVSNNVSLDIQKLSYAVDESVVIRMLGVPVLDASLYLDIYLLEDPSYSYRYLGIVEEDITFIPPKSGVYGVKLFSIKNGQPTLLSEARFLVEDIATRNDPIPRIENELVSEPEIEKNVTSENLISENSSENALIFSSVKRNKFGGATTDFEKYQNDLSSLKNLSNVILENPGKGRIRWHGSLNVLNADIDTNIQIGRNLIVVNSEILDKSFNSSATLAMYDVPFSFPVILKNNLLCKNCQIKSYVDRVLEFDVESFSAYSVVENTSLTIWDNNEDDENLYDGNLTKYVDQDITFFANYTNQSDNSSILGADCLISFSTNYSESFGMMYDAEIGLYLYTHSFNDNGTYQYNISCNKTEFYSLNLSDSINVDLAGDLAVYPYEISFSNNYPVENETITINAFVHSLTDYNFTEVLVKFYDGDPSDNGILIRDVYVNVTGLSNVTVDSDWSVKVGLHKIYVVAEPTGDDKDMGWSNNNAYNTTFISLWQIYYGNMLSSTSNLGSDTNVFINWSLVMTASANIYVASPDSNINWASLEAITRNTTGEQDSNTLDDFNDIDLTLGIENFSDSVNSTYSSGGYPIRTSNYTIYHVSVRDVPEVVSTNNTNFYTGILWDTSDTSSSYYSYESNPLIRSDLVFVAKANHDKEGAYGMYDYEIRIPAFLRNYRDDGGVVQFYYEIQ